MYTNAQYVRMIHTERTLKDNIQIYCILMNSSPLGPFFGV